MTQGFTRRRLIGASALSALTAAGAVFAADTVAGTRTHHKSPTERVAPRPEKVTTAVRTEVFWRAQPTEKLVSLTFDDGPDPQWTPTVLELLAEYDARSTFFQLGDEVERHPELARQVANAGHEVGSHGCSHQDFTDLSADELRENLGRADESIRAATGITPTLVRPPWGRIDSPGMFVAAEFGYQVALWSHHLPTDGAEQKVDLNIATASPGMIVLCHDGRSTPADSLYVAVRRLLTELTDQGYRFVTVSDLLSAKPT